MKILCKKCKEDLLTHSSLKKCSYVLEENKGIKLFSDENEGRSAEEVTRNTQAIGYLNHIKISSQVKFFGNFISKIKKTPSDCIVLDLGCGPGPTVKIMADGGFNEITAIDFSENSLRINRSSNNSKMKINWIKADLRLLIFEPNSVDVLIMADFIQHVGSYEDKVSLLKNALSALKQGGYLYFSFFNFNLYNYFKGDLRGTFANGSIPYERLLSTEMLKLLAEDVNVLTSYPMNITQNYKIDKFLGFFPFTKFAATMYAIEGQKK